ncbi:MAG: alpha/beta hydrolase [Nannocystaceae bacterium]
MPISTADAVALARRLWTALPDRRDDALAVLNGLFGDHLEAADSSLAIPLRLYGGPEREPLGEPPAFDPGPRTCLLVHGLMGTEHAWALGTGPDGAQELGKALGEARDVKPIYARYNTGRHISINGRQLAERLEALHVASPLRELTIVAHSMGGLVTRSACHYGLEQGHGWVEHLQRVFLLGVPSHGAPLEQLVHVAAFTLESIWNPWTKLIGRALNLRSAGIKDLRHGFVLDEDWRHRDPDQLALRRPRPADQPEHVQWYVVAGTLGRLDGAWAQILGDGLVRAGSAHGKGFGTPTPGLLPQAQTLVLPEISHMGLMNDPRVLEQVLQWWPPIDA